MATRVTDQRFKFLLEQFKLHSEKLHDYHGERYKFTTWGILAVFGYCGWILTKLDASCTILNFVAFLPLIFFTFFGFWYVYNLHQIIDRHSLFLNHLENEIFFRPVGAETEWEKFKPKGHQGKRLRKIFYMLWGGLCCFAIVFSALYLNIACKWL